MTQPRPLALAAVIGAHGVRGEVRLKLLGEGLDALRTHSHFNDGSIEITMLRDDGKGGAIARLAGVTDRGAAEKLRGTVLHVDRAALPPLEPGEFYYADLIGLPVETDMGAAVGHVVDVVHYGATEIVEIERTGGGRFMVPLIPDAVPEWDGARVVVATPYAEA